MLELALSAAVMVSCLAGTFQFGYTFYVYNELVTRGGQRSSLRGHANLSRGVPADIEKGKRRFAIWWSTGTRGPRPSAVPVTSRI